MFAHSHSTLVVAAMLGCFLAAPLLIVWEWIRVRQGRASDLRAARAGRVLVTAAVLFENLWWIPALSYNHAYSSVSIAAWYAAIPLSFVALVLYFSVRTFKRELAFWACWLNILAVGVMLTMLAGSK